MKVLMQQIQTGCTNSARAVRPIRHAVLGAILVATLGRGMTESAVAVVQQAAELVPRAVAPSPLVVEAMVMKHNQHCHEPVAVLNQHLKEFELLLELPSVEVHSDEQQGFSLCASKLHSQIKT